MTESIKQEEFGIQKINVLGVEISAVDPSQALNRIEHWILNKKKAYVCVAPVSTVVDCQNEEDYRNVINQADMVTPDGMPLVWLGKIRGVKSIERTYGPDLMLMLCRRGQDKGYKHYFYGGTEETLKQLEIKLKQRFSKINIVGKYSPPFREISEDETRRDVELINQAQPDILWVGLGSPKQDFWMYKNRDKLKAPVMIGVGAAFDFLAGTKKQAPRWLRQAGFEWLFRLCCEPRRLWKRYFIGNTKFIYFLVKEELQKQFNFKQHDSKN